MPRCSVGHARQARGGGGLAVFRELNAALPSPSPVVSGGHPSLPPPGPGDRPQQVTGGELWVTQYGRHGVFLILQAGCHGTAVDQFGGGTEKAPALSLATHCQALDAQGESQANQCMSQGFNLFCTVFTLIPRGCGFDDPSDGYCGRKNTEYLELSSTLSVKKDLEDFMHLIILASQATVAVRGLGLYCCAPCYVCDVCRCSFLFLTRPGFIVGGKTEGGWGPDRQFAKEVRPPGSRQPKSSWKNYN